MSDLNRDIVNFGNGLSLMLKSIVSGRAEGYLRDDPVSAHCLLAVFAQIMKENLVSYEADTISNYIHQNPDGTWDSVKNLNLVINWRALSWELPIIYSVAVTAEQNTPEVVACAGLLIARDVIGKRKTRISNDHGVVAILIWNNFRFEEWYRSSEIVEYLEKAAEKEAFQGWSGPKNGSIREVVMELADIGCLEIDGSQVRIVEKCDTNASRKIKSVED